MDMEQNLNSEKTPARASQQSANKVSTVGGAATGEQGEEHLDEVAMKAAKRAQNRFREDETVVPGSTEFTK